MALSNMTHLGTWPSAQYGREQDMAGVTTAPSGDGPAPSDAAGWQTVMRVPASHLLRRGHTLSLHTQLPQLYSGVNSPSSQG